MSGSRAIDIGLLRRNRLFGVLEPDEIRSVLSFAQRQRAAIGERIFSKGEPGDSFYAILSGQLAVHTESNDAKVMFLNILVEGDVFGEVAMLDGGPRTASVTAQQPSTLLRFDRADFLPFLEVRPNLTVRLMGVLCERLRWTSAIIEDTIFLNVTRRLAKRILLLAQQHGRQNNDGIRIATFVSQADLAQMLGATREIVNRTLRSFQAAGAISYRNGYMIVRDTAYLEKIAG